MKVKVSFTIDIDPNEWIANYGCDKKDVRADVRDYVYHGTYAQFADMGYLAKPDKDPTDSPEYKAWGAHPE